MNIFQKTKKKYLESGFKGVVLTIIFKLDNFFFYKFAISLSSYFKKNLDEINFNTNDIKDRFNYIYKENLWGSKESVSGPGSEKNQAKLYSEGLIDFINKYKINSIFDAPCGDFNWIENVLEKVDIKYLGGDLVPDIIKINKEKYNEYNFIEFDITKDKFDDCDLFHCRDCLFHFSYEDIIKTFKNFASSNIKYILFTNQQGVFKNNDITTGGFRFLDLRKKPFYLEKPILKIKDYFFFKEIPKYLYLYKREDIIRNLNKFSNEI